MASNIPTSYAEQFVEERLIAAMVTGSLLQHKGLLDMLENVDSRMIMEKTLLHVGVGLGKAEWVEELLARGADTVVTDDSQQSALSLAEEMVWQFPDDAERSRVLNLVTLVHRRDQVILRRLEASSSRSTGHVSPMASPECDIASLKSSVDTLRQEMKSLVNQLSSSLEELKVQVCLRDALMRCLEEAVTSTAANVTSINFGLNREACLSQPTFDPLRSRQECVDAMMRKTSIVYGSGVDKMRKMYERLYDEDECSVSIIKYLIGDDRVKVMVDLESENIERMKKKVVLLYGTEANGSKWYSYCDLESETVYLGAKGCSGDREKDVSSWLAWALLQLSLKLVFYNEWRPYRKGDVKREREWKRALEELEGRRERGVRIDDDINNALCGKTGKAKMCWLAATVPRIIAAFGSTGGRVILQKNYHLLKSLYFMNVIGTRISKAKR